MNKTCEACELEEEVHSINFPEVKHTCGKKEHKTFNFVDSQINPEHYKDCHCEVKCKPNEALPSWEANWESFKYNELSLPIGAIHKNANKQIIDFIRQTIKAERAEAVKEIIFWIKDWYAEDKPFGIEGLIKKIKKL